ncbi:MAG: hypothetical protein TQ37_00370, partial [Candidatus Synechococcus spongiarum 15L]
MELAGLPAPDREVIPDEPTGARQAESLACRPGRVRQEPVADIAVVDRRTDFGRQTSALLHSAWPMQPGG